MAFPATQDPSTLNSLASGIFPSVAEGVRDLIKKEIPMFYILEKMGVEKVGNWGARYLVRVQETDDSEPTSFTGLDTLSKGTVQGVRSAIFNFANYDINVTIPWEDELILTGAEALGDLVEETTFKQCRSLGGRMSDDMVHGNQSNSKNCIGLEQSVITKVHDTTGTAYSSPRWQFRQTTSTYGGVARVAHTATSGGTGFESLSVDLADLSAAPESTFKSATLGAPTELHSMFTRFVNCLTYEGTSPDYMLSTWLPQEDMSNASFGYQRIQQGDKDDGLDIGINIARYKGLTWYASEKFAHSLVSPTGGTVPTITDIIYVLNSKSWSYLVHKNANWANVPFINLTDQAGAIGRIRHRFQLVCEDPGLNGSLYNYGG